MKKLLIFILLFPALPGFSQVKLPFPDSAVWKMNYAKYFFPPNTPTISNFVHRAGGSTIINGVSYINLYGRGGGHFRIDGKKVYFRAPVGSMPSGLYTDTVEVVLYDFALQVGDSAFMPDGSSHDTYMIVAAIDSIRINGHKYKRIIFDISIYWVEGFGGNQGFFPSNFLFEEEMELGCIHTSDISINFDWYGQKPCKSWGLEESEFNSGRKIYPNPSMGIFTLENLNPTAEKLLLQVVNSSGQVVYTSEYGDEEIQLDLQSQPDGLYLLRTQKGNSINQKRIVIQK